MNHIKIMFLLCVLFESTLFCAEDNATNEMQPLSEIAGKLCSYMNEDDRKIFADNCTAIEQRMESDDRQKNDAELDRQVITLVYLMQKYAQQCDAQEYSMLREQMRALIQHFMDMRTPACDQQRSMRTTGAYCTATSVTDALPRFSTTDCGLENSDFSNPPFVTTPQNTAPLIINDNSSASTDDVDIAVVPKNKGAFVASIPDGTSTGGNARGNFATDLQRNRSLATQVASGTGSTISGGGNNSAQNQYDVVAGGFGNTISQDFSSIAGGLSNRVTTTVSFIGGGSNNVITGTVAAIAGGQNNTAQSDFDFIGGGHDNITTNNLSVIVGGANNTTISDFAIVGGGFLNTASSLSFVGGGNNNAATGLQSIVVGGSTNAASGDQSFIGGGSSNIASGFNGTICGGLLNLANATGAFVGGGALNTASAGDATVGGGDFNTASGVFATVSGGDLNIASGSYATVGGGQINTSNHNSSTIGGGSNNRASGNNATVGGGASNTASGLNSTVPGGSSSTAAGDYSFAAGRRAKANNTGAFVWADSTNQDFTSSANDQFNVRASGGSLIYSNAGLTAGVSLAAGGNAWAGISDRNLKENFAEVDAVAIMKKLAHMPVKRFNYKSQPSSIKHMGVMAQDFYPAFELGENPLMISTQDMEGVTLAGLQGLYKLYQELNERVMQLES